MTEQELTTAQSDEQEIDLLELARKLWAHRRKLLTWGAIGAVVGLIIAFSIPREYSTTVKLSPELGDKQGGRSSLGALASFAGISTGASGADAVYPQIYPDVVSSVPFLTSLFDVEVPTEPDGKKVSVQTYMTEEISAPWWSAIMSLPYKILGLFSKKQAEETDHTIDNFRLTPQEAGMVNALSRRIAANYDSQNSMISISVQMQDPLVSAILADTVVSRLQTYVTAYRTNKARKDLEYAEQINAEAQQAYYKAQQALATYSDRNQGLATQSARITRERLENESQLAFALYNQTSRQVQAAKISVQEQTPVYVTVSPATVPHSPVSPNKMLILVGFTFLGVLACALWVLFIKPMLATFKEKPDDKQ